MERIVNYLDIPGEEKSAVIERLFHIGFCPAHGRQTTVKREMEQSKRDALPQYLFVFREDELIGYLFLIGEETRRGRIFPWWAAGNPDELPLETASRLLECGIRLSRQCGCPSLADRLREDLERQKKGIGRRPEDACR